MKRIQFLPVNKNYVLDNCLGHDNNLMTPQYEQATNKDCHIWDIQIHDLSDKTVRIISNAANCAFPLVASRSRCHLNDTPILAESLWRITKGGRRGEYSIFSVRSDEQLCILEIPGNTPNGNSNYKVITSDDGHHYWNILSEEDVIMALPSEIIWNGFQGYKTQNTKDMGRLKEICNAAIDEAASLKIKLDYTSEENELMRIKSEADSTTIKRLYKEIKDNEISLDELPLHAPVYLTKQKQLIVGLIQHFNKMVQNILCPVCLSDIKEYSGECGHLYCLQCITKCIEDRGLCYQCNFNIGLARKIFE